MNINDYLSLRLRKIKYLTIAVFFLFLAPSLFLFLYQAYAIVAFTLLVVFLLFSYILYQIDSDLKCEENNEKINIEIIESINKQITYLTKNQKFVIVGLIIGLIGLPIISFFFYLNNQKEIMNLILAIALLLDGFFCSYLFYNSQLKKVLEEIKKH